MSLLRVIVDGPGPAAWNMAVDEVLLDGEQSSYPATLRFYRWRRPAVSLGYAQPGARGFDPEVARREGIGVVRRPTGGRAVLHADELTYALAAPAAGALAGGVSASYRVLAEALARGLAAIGAEVAVEDGSSRGAAAGGRPERSSPRPDAARGACYAARSRHELSVDGRKLVGSAQRRRRGRLLQHGAIPLGRPEARRWRVLGADGEEAAAAAVGLRQVLAEAPSDRLLVAALSASLAAALGRRPLFRPLSAGERRRAARLTRRYADPACYS